MQSRSDHLRVGDALERVVLWSAPLVLFVLLFWSMGSRRPVAAVALVAVFAASCTVQVRRALRHDGVDREVMLRSAAISHPIVATVAFAALVASLFDLVDAATGLAVAVVVAVFMQGVVASLLTRRLG